MKAKARLTIGGGRDFDNGRVSFISTGNGKQLLSLFQLAVIAERSSYHVLPLPFSATIAWPRHFRLSSFHFYYYYYY
jgi:hypothetical protein